MRMIIICCCFVSVFYSCGVKQNDYDSLKKSYDSLSVDNNNKIKILRDSILLFKYPASERFSKIKDLIKDEKLDEATEEIFYLKDLFPTSIEAKESISLKKIIDEKIVEKQKKEERLKALGYKAFNDNMRVSYNKIIYSFAGFTFGRTFTFDYVLDVDEYSYNTADKDNTYLLISMTAYSKEKDANPSTVALYKIENGKLKFQDTFQQEFATYNTYAAKIGNYDEDSHDFSKVSTIHYKLATEISKTLMKVPLFVLISKNNNESFLDNSNSEITIDRLRNNFIVVKVINRNSL